MTTYYITISHHSISRAPAVRVEGSLLRAKQVATRRFGDGYPDHTIVIKGEDGYPVSERRIGDKRWVDWGC